MASIGGAGGVPEYMAAWPSGRGGQRDMPGSLATALVLVHTLFAVTVIGGFGLLLTAASYDALDGGVPALTAYAAAPGVLGWWLARRTWRGGARVRGGLIAVQLDRIEYAALKEIARNKGDMGKSQQLQRDPKFVDNPAKVEKAKEIYDGTYR